MGGNLITIGAAQVFANANIVELNYSAFVGGPQPPNAAFVELRNVVLSLGMSRHIST